MIRKIHLLSILAFILFASSCNNGVVYSHKETVDGSVWNYNQELLFELNGIDTSSYYDLVLEVNHSSEFSYENLYTRISTKFPSGESIKDIVSLQFADKMGNWLGNCNSSTCKTELLIQERFRFKEVGAHKISLENFSRNALEGINSLEMKLYTITKK